MNDLPSNPPPPKGVSTAVVILSLGFAVAALAAVATGVRNRALNRRLDAVEAQVQQLRSHPLAGRGPAMGGGPAMAPWGRRGGPEAMRGRFAGPERRGRAEGRGRQEKHGRRDDRERAEKHRRHDRHGRRQEGRRHERKPGHPQDRRPERGREDFQRGGDRRGFDGPSRPGGWGRPGERQQGGRPGQGGHGPGPGGQHFGPGGPRPGPDGAKPNPPPAPKSAPTPSGASPVPAPTQS